MTRLNRRAKASRRTAARRAANAGPGHYARVEPQHNTRPPADAALDAMLIKRGWDLLDRAENADIYDWCASYCMEAGEVTYLIVDAPDNQAFSDRYRICMINGERRTYEIVDGLLVDLDAIEARRCEDRGAQDRRRRSRGDA